jgi:hypothetical protein
MLDSYYTAAKKSGRYPEDWLEYCLREIEATKRRINAVSRSDACGQTMDTHIRLIIGGIERQQANRLRPSGDVTMEGDLYGMHGRTEAIDWAVRDGEGYKTCVLN